MISDLDLFNLVLLCHLAVLVGSTGLLLHTTQSSMVSLCHVRELK